MYYIKILTCNLVGNEDGIVNAGSSFLVRVIHDSKPRLDADLFLAVSPGLYQEFGGHSGYAGTGTLFGIPFIVLKGNPGHYVFWATQYEAMSADRLNVNTIIRTNKDFYIF